MKKIDGMSFFKYLEESEKERISSNNTDKVNYFDVIKQRCLHSLSTLKNTKKFNELCFRVPDHINEIDVKQILEESNRSYINIHLEKVYRDDDYSKYDDYKEGTTTVFYTELI